MVAVPSALVPPWDRSMAVPNCLLRLLGPDLPLAVAMEVVGLAVPLAGLGLAVPVVGLAVPSCSVVLVAAPKGRTAPCPEVVAALEGRSAVAYTQAVP